MLVGKNCVAVFSNRYTSTGMWYFVGNIIIGTVNVIQFVNKNIL